MKKKKRKNEMAEIEDLLLDWEFPFEGQKKETYYNYHCQKCGYKEEVPAFIVDEMKAMDKLDNLGSPGMPILECPYCPGGMVYKGEKE
ncbi:MULTISPECIES: hypothetical protein [Carboxydocella]|uniref:Uncharacterized protein n=1 Tax=Carboxydocella thermautotrophica TaxID=178899 RepID=A0A2R4N327_CARTR|nr:MULTISPECIES: hypothetical protein [Carboxydocella]AVX21503.1 hypothetical protein CFE_2360 [Carboxydocella thermautotrophica]AVX31991.1 hypothetical protein CTH_2452 [Carboxydocella thermautotrophica]GAW28171.1 hypothetical protein ULO1_07410 [Carboxydocella sp. ULO1]